MNIPKRVANNIKKGFNDDVEVIKRSHWDYDGIYKTYYQVYKNNSPVSAGKTKKEALEGYKRNERIKKKWSKIR